MAFAIAKCVAMLGLAGASISAGAGQTRSGFPGDGRLPVLNRSEVRLMAGRFGAETPQTPHSIRIYPRARADNPVIRFVLRPGEHRPNETSGAERAELRSNLGFHHGATRWYSGAFRIADFEPDSAFNIIMQWHSNAAVGHNGPWLRFALEPHRRGRLQIEHRGRSARGRESRPSVTGLAISLNEWHRFVVEARTDPWNGLLKVWIDGQLRVDWSGGLLGDFQRHGSADPNMGFWKFGIYRWRRGSGNRTVRSTADIRFTNMEQGADLSGRVRHPLALPRPGAGQPD